MVVVEPWHRRSAIDAWPPTMRQIEHAARNVSQDVSNKTLRLQNVTNGACRRRRPTRSARRFFYLRSSSTRSQRARHDSVNAMPSAAAASVMTQTSVAIVG